MEIKDMEQKDQWSEARQKPDREESKKGKERYGKKGRKRRRKG